MDSTPPSHRSRTKSASRLARVKDFTIETEDIPHLSLDPTVSPSPKISLTPSASPISRKSSDCLPLRELLLLSPSPLRRSRTRLVERLEMIEEPAVELAGPRRRSKNRGGQTGLSACGSPRNVRRSRRRSEVEIREDKELEEIVKPRKKRHSGKSKKEKMSLVPVAPPSSLPPTPKSGDVDQGSLDQIGQAITDLVTWTDVAKSTLWFGFGCLCFLSSCFAGGINFSIFSALSQLGLLFLGASFFSKSISQRNNCKNGREFKLREDDILRMARVILPVANLAILKTRDLFSGEPSMTLKVAPILLLGAEYGHLITLRRLCAAGFFISFTVPKLYSSHSSQIKQKADYLRGRMLEAWHACSHKKVVAASAVTAFWNLTSVKTRIFAAFISVVILRCYRQNPPLKSDKNEAVGGGEQDQVQEQEEEKAEQQPQQALVVAEAVSQG